MRHSSHLAAVIFLSLSVASAKPAKHSDQPLTPVRTTTQRGTYTIDTVGDTLGQASPQNTRVIIRISGSDKKLIKPSQIGLVDRAGAMIKPIFREDRKVGHEENTGLPVSVNNGAVGLDLKKVFGSHGDYAYTKVDWPKSVFTGDKTLQINLPGGQSFALPLTSLAR